MFLKVLSDLFLSAFTGIANSFSVNSGLYKKTTIVFLSVTTRGPLSMTVRNVVLRLSHTSAAAKTFL